MHSLTLTHTPKRRSLTRPPVEAFLEAGMLPLLLQQLRAGVAARGREKESAGDDAAVLAEVLWLLSMVISKENMELVMASDCVAALLAVLDPSAPLSNEQLWFPAVKVLGCLTAGKDEYTDAILNQAQGRLAFLETCLASTHRGLRKETCWLLSNIAGGGPGHVDFVMASGALPRVCEIFLDTQFDIRKEIAFLLYNLARDARGQHAKLKTILECNNLLYTFLCLCKAPDVEANLLALRWVDLVLRVVPGGPQLVEENDGIECLEALQDSENEECWRVSSALVDEFYGEDYGYGEEEAVPEEHVEYPAWRLGAQQQQQQQNTGQQFQF